MDELRLYRRSVLVVSIWRLASLLSLSSWADNLGLLASKAIGPTATRGQLYGIAAAIGKGEY
jgi:hypothetical protein